MSELKRPKIEDYMHPELENTVKQPDYTVALENYAEALEMELEQSDEQVQMQLIELQKLKEVLDIIMAEINSTPMLAQYFDLRIIRKANELLKKEP